MRLIVIIGVRRGEERWIGRKKRGFDVREGEKEKGR
jgi:hypothetical protein